MPRPTFVCLTNIPTPYRLFQFRLMQHELAYRGWKFEVWFMAASEPRRSWTFNESEFSFPHRFLGRLPLRIGSNPLYLNPELISLLRKTRPEILLVAGGWIHPSVCLTCMSPARRRTIFWSESHLGSIRRTGLGARSARRFVLSRFRRFAVPGELARKYVEHHVASARIYYLPNIVDPSIFRDKVRSTRRTASSRYGNQKRVLFMSARLAPEKGILQFLNGLQLLNEDAKQILTVRVAGSGPQLAEVQQWISNHDLDVSFLGDQSEAEMVKLYAEADGFCLPSISDPNPVSVIEALWAGLPLLLSSRVGNHIECLRDQENGFLFDPENPRSIVDAVSRWLSLSLHDLVSFGENSLEIAQRKFDPDKVLSEFLDQVLADSDVEPQTSVGAVEMATSSER